MKSWGRTFCWKRRVGQRDAEVARAVADRSIEDAVERTLTIRMLVEVGLVRVAKAIAEGKVNVTVADLDRLIRLDEFLREDIDGRVILEWRDYDTGDRSEDHKSDADVSNNEESDCDS